MIVGLGSFAIQNPNLGIHTVESTNSMIVATCTLFRINVKMDGQLQNRILASTALFGAATIIAGIFETIISTCELYPNNHNDRSLSTFCRWLKSISISAAGIVLGYDLLMFSGNVADQYTPGFLLTTLKVVACKALISKEAASQNLAATLTKGTLLRPLWIRFHFLWVNPVVKYFKL